MNFFDKFPVEIIEIIFLHLKEQVLELTLISPRANRIISNSKRLMKNLRLKVRPFRWLSLDQQLAITRKYSSIDFHNVLNPVEYRDLAESLAEMTLESITIQDGDFHSLLSKTSNTLELLVIFNCTINYVSNEDWYVKLIETTMKPLPFPKMKTLIIEDMLDEYCCYFALSTIRATNLTELGLIKSNGILECEHNLEAVNNTFLNTVKRCSPTLKILHVPYPASEVFIDNISTFQAAGIHLEELSIDFRDDRSCLDPEGFEEVMKFAESQKTTLKSCRFEGCIIDNGQAKRLLSLNLERLELVRGSSELSEVCENLSIESLALVGIDDSESNFISNLLASCKKLSAFTVSIMQSEPPNPLFLKMSKSWKRIDSSQTVQKPIRWSDLRSVRYVGVWSASELLTSCRDYDFFDQSNGVSTEKHPYSIIKFTEKAQEQKKPINNTLVNPEQVRLLMDAMALFMSQQT